MEVLLRMFDACLFATGMSLYPFRKLTLDGRAMLLLNCIFSGLLIYL